MLARVLERHLLEMALLAAVVEAQEEMAVSVLAIRLLFPLAKEIMAAREVQTMQLIQTAEVEAAHPQLAVMQTPA